eukprot:TRINITY_DN14173_c0_g1_i1.p1 TRINITY_DN14173_c0_g1~~TRINITY_DN14173_c0_g1_i1.p1  ORF type:complete len:322 (+),score=2.20 TRINITY_DN14173_c0_g1_i1:109-1074(+)
MDKNFGIFLALVIALSPFVNCFEKDKISASPHSLIDSNATPTVQIAGRQDSLNNYDDETQNVEDNRLFGKEAKRQISTRLMGTTEYIRAEANCSKKVQLGEKYTVSLTLSPHIHYAPVRMKVADACEIDSNYQCIKTNSNDPYLEEELIIDLRDSGNEFYEGEYRIFNNKPGDITLIFYLKAHGLHRVCYKDTEFKEPLNWEQYDPDIYFNWETGAVCNDREDYVVIRWTSKLIIDTGGKYIFKLGYDDMARLHINNDTVLDNWGKNAPITWVETSISLVAGKHDFVLDYGENGGPMYLSLIHICRCRRYAVCRSRWSPYH